MRKLTVLAVLVLALFAMASMAANTHSPPAATAQVQAQANHTVDLTACLNTNETTNITAAMRASPLPQIGQNAIEASDTYYAIDRNVSQAIGALRAYNEVDLVPLEYGWSLTRASPQTTPNEMKNVTATARPAATLRI
jgi:hypothetical protein